MSCLNCTQPAMTPDGLCADCALAGSDWTGLYDVTLTLDGGPATTPEEVRTALDALGWPSASFEPQDPESGAWLLELPPTHMRLLLTFGHVCHTAGGARVEVNLP